ncbi:thyroid hormone receptor interactor 12 [Aphelenchoides avenae]|nr:thyroid hormone receptor interactor 12 [Aphelenchus avenae]
MKTTEDFEALELYFTYPGDESFELVDGGKKIALAKENMRQFIELVCYWRLVEGVRPEMEAVRKGFDLVVTNINLLKIFTADEMEELFCGCSEKERRSGRRARFSKRFVPITDMLQSYSKDKRRKFLQFVTGSPRLPVGGFRALNPPLTVVRKTASYGNSENELPSAMTCYNYLKIPPYATYETFVERFDVALQFIYSFHMT